MLMSKGLRWSSHAIGNSRRRPVITGVFLRQFGSQQHNARLVSREQIWRAPSSALSRGNCRPQIVVAVPGIPFPYNIRHASTESATAPASSSLPLSSTPPSVEPFSQPTSGFSSNELVFEDLASMPMHIGYLKNLGLDFGYGPTAMMESILEHVHLYAGTPWWASISLTVILLRVVMLKSYVGASDTSARLAGIKRFTQPITDKMVQAQAMGDQAAIMSLRRELKQIHNRAGIQMWKAFLPMLQVFIGFGTFRLMRAVSSLPVPGLETGGTSWFLDLTIPDPLYIMPAVTAGLTVLTMKLSQGGLSILPEHVQKALTYGLPVVILAVMVQWPAALQLSFFVSTILSVVQVSILRSNVFRGWLGIAPMPRLPQAPASASKYTGNLNLGESAKGIVKASATSSSKRAGGLGGMMEKAKTEVREMQQEMTKTVEKYTGSQGGKSGPNRAAASYEKRRSAEEEAQRLKELQAKRDRWLAKKQNQKQS